ncbi:hypothetical protein SK128_022864 [Halocaridina rubra]|uniref:Transglutaminase-like domain-containing protein n=1 Tax=Halocaridina rubra TaxID=373956 RepID=A0AAN8WLX0_HALRR
MVFLDCIENYFEKLADRFKKEFEERRRADRRQELEDIARYTSLHANDVPVDIEYIDFQSKANAANHHCDKYEVIERGKDTSVLRRGGTFTFVVTFTQECDLKKKHIFKIYFTFGSSPSIHNGTQVILEASGKKTFDKRHDEWDIRVIETEGKNVKFEVQVETDAIVGVWRVASVVCERDTNSITHLQRLDHLIYILFNPWNKNDSTFLPDETQRQEYILNDVGKIWVGSYPSVHGRHWIFGQFDVAVLPACVLLLEKSGVNSPALSDPILVSRAISRIVNSFDDDGIIVGNWSEEYSDGTAPTKWTGSIPILEQYMRFEKPVKYGQCWVFAGVVTTVCRALGLPSRVVTNLNSAQDTNSSLTVDKYFSPGGEEYIFDDHEKDRIWDFHVWNDVWMSRPDLPVCYGGWQVIDATPNVTSDGLCQCGPASHVAIRRGDTHLKYDVQYVLAEVNADVVYWLVNENSESRFQKLNSNSACIGQQILTKAIGNVVDSCYDDVDKEDITAIYKQKEGSQIERVIMHTAALRSKEARDAYLQPRDTDGDVEFSIIDTERVPIGHDFSVTVKAKNKCDKTRTVNVVLRACSTYYTGNKAYDIAKADGEFPLRSNETQEFSLPVNYASYCEKLVEYSTIRILALCSVKETNYIWVGEDKFQVLKPNIKLEVILPPKVGRISVVGVSFTNPLPVALTNCSLMVDAPGIMRPKTIQLDNVDPKAEMLYELKMYPWKKTTSTVVATFNSKELIDLTGSTALDIGS